MLPGLPFLYTYSVIKRICQSKNDANPMLMTAIACNVVNLICGYLFVQRYGWRGAALARSIGNAVEVPIILGCMLWKGWRSESSSPPNGKRILRESGYSSIGGDVTEEWGTQQYLEIGGCSKSSFAKDSRLGVDEECQKETDAEFLRHVYAGFVAWEEALSAKAIMDFMRLGIPGMLQVMFEWYVFLHLHH
jgi:Na+-driven multidrug efflux pump